MAVSSTQLLRVIQQFRRYYDRHFSELLSRTGLSMREIHVVLFLANHPAHDTARDVTELRGLAKSQVSAAVDLLAARELLSEEGVLVERSATNADYSPVGLLSAPWAQYGTLAEAYPASTLAVDDTQGLLYRPYKEDPSFGPVSRTDLFGARRMALVGDELMLFQTVVLEGSETTRLSGVVRGYMNTPVQAHASGAAIWVFRNPGEGNTVQGLSIGTHNMKLRPVSGDEVLGADRVDRLSFAVTGKAMVPWPVAGLRAVRTGDSVTVSWSPVDVAFGGAGTRTENENEPVPAGFSGDFVLTAAGTEHVVNGTSLTLTRSGRFTLSVTARQLGYVSPAAYVTVESQDGEYVA